MNITDSSYSNNKRSNFFNVKIGEIVVAKAPAILKTTLGSCVTAILYDKVNNIAGMIHVMFPDSKGLPTDTPGKFADIGIPLLLQRTIRAGAERRNIQVFIVGGNYLTETNGEGRITFDVGKSNLVAVKKALDKENLSYKEVSTAKDTGTIAIFDVETGKLKVKFLEKFRRSNMTFKKSNIINYEDFLEIVRQNINKTIKSINPNYKPILLGNDGEYNSAISINIYGYIKGKLILYSNKEFIHNLLNHQLVSSKEPNYTKSLKIASEKFLTPIKEKLLHIFKEKKLRVKFTEPTIFNITKYVKLNFNYPENMSAIFKINNNIIKIALTLGKVKQDD